MKKIDFFKPEFLLCEIPIKNKTFHDSRKWIYSTGSLSLIEFINVTDFKDFGFTDTRFRFEFENKNGEFKDYFGVFVQNNCEVTENNESVIMQKSWLVFENYLKTL